MSIFLDMDTRVASQYTHGAVPEAFFGISDIVSSGPNANTPWYQSEERARIMIYRVVFDGNQQRRI